MAVELSFSTHLLSGLIKTANSFIRRDDYTVRRWLSSIEEIKFPACSTPMSGVSTRDVYTGSETSCSWFRLFIPHKEVREDSSSCPVVIYYHGGGFAVLRPDFFLYDLFCRRLAKAADCVVVSVNYPLAPENGYPSVHEASFEFLRWFKSNFRRHLPAYADVSRCFLSGDSAGGNLAYYVSRRAAVEADELSPICVKGNVLVNPFFGGEERTESEMLFKDGPIITLEMTDWYWKAYLPEGEDRDHPICNVFGPRSGDVLSGVQLPPFLVIVGEYDLLKDWQVGFVQGLQNAGKSVKLMEYKKGVHVFHIFNWLEESAQVLADITEFMKYNS